VQHSQAKLESEVLGGEV